MTDLEQLAARLVEATEKAVLDQRDRDWAAAPRGASYDLQAFFQSEQRAGIVALLRTLDELVMERVRDGLDPIALSGLADFIEKGGGHAPQP